MPRGGRLVIETQNILLNDAYCRAHLKAKPGDYVLLTISDTGHGMDAETQDHIFEPFYTTKEAGKGTGLGLAMVYGLVKNHGGRITCYSEPGSWSTFKIYVPAIEHINMRQEAQSGEDMPEGGGETILIVDDEDFIRDFGKQMLTRWGYTVFTATSGEEGLAFYDDLRDKIDLVILDLIMPGMGGEQCLEKILEIDPDAKVIITSGYSGKGPAMDAINGGALGFIDKPYGMRQMLKGIRAVLDDGSSGYAS